MKTMMVEDREMNMASNEKKEFQRWMFAFFVIFFITALVTRLLPRSLRPMASNDGTRQSVYEEALQAAHNVVPYIFVLH